MRARRLYCSVITAVIIAIAVTVPSVAKYIADAPSFVFEITIQSSARGIAQLFYDIGNGIREDDSVRVQVTNAAIPTTYQFRLPEGNYRSLRFDPLDQESTMTLVGAKILDPTGRTVIAFSPSQFLIVQQIQTLRTDGDALMATTIANANDPILSLSIGGPLTLGHAGLGDEYTKAISSFLVVLALAWPLIWLGETRWRGWLTARGRSFQRWANAHPDLAIGGIAILAVLMSCYPIVFFNKSFVSPNNGTTLLYDTFPTLPGYQSAALEDVRGADIGAIMWAHVPYSVVESGTLFREYSLPLWNRFNSSGVSLLGQGQSMLGDPLHLIVLLAGGASWAWDTKYLLAKVLFCIGAGMMVYAATRHLFSSMILAFSSAYIGFFSYRFNHPALFSLCYSPWILYSWLKVVQSRTSRESFIWTGGVILANWMVLTSGTVKEAYMLMAVLNLCGLLMLLFSEGDVSLKVRQGLRLTCAGVLFALISAPIWTTFLETLEYSYTSYDIPSALQIPPYLLIGFFDDIFYRFSAIGQTQDYPSANFVVLLGVLWSLAQFRILVKNRTYLAVALSALIPFSLAFGVAPASAIVKIPFLGNIVHVGNVFSVVLIVHLILLAGFGLRAAWERVLHQDGTSDALVVLLMLGGLVFLYFGSSQLAKRPPFFYWNCLLLLCTLLLLPVLVRRMIGHAAPETSFSIFLLLLIGFASMQWRHGMYIKTGFDAYVMNPQIRVDLQAPSPAVEFIKNDQDPPYRTVGLGDILYPGYNATLGIESIGGPDAMINRYYRELLKAASFDWGWDWRVIVSTQTLAELKPVCDFLNVRYYLTSEEEKPSELANLRFLQASDLDIYSSPTAWPRAFFTDTLLSYDSATDLMTMISRGDGRPFAAVQRDEIEATPELATFLGDPAQRVVEAASDYRLANNTTSFTIHAPGRGVVVLNEAFIKEDFAVTINGESTPYFRLNHAFKGVIVNAPGDYVVSFRYWPRYMTLSLTMLGVGIGLFGAWGIFLWRTNVIEILQGARSTWAF